MGVTRDLIRMFTTASFDQIPEAAVDITKKAILDDVGIGLLGYSMAGEKVVEYAKTVGAGTPESSLIGDGTKVSCMAAAAANAQMAFDTDFNETGPGHHIMSPLAQTALAVGEHTGASGEEVITAVATAYQLSGHLHMALVPESVDGGQGTRHIPAAVALTAGTLLGLSEEELNHAFGLAWFMIPMPTTTPFWHEWWRRRGMFHLAMVQHGMLAALLAKTGFEGPRDIIEADLHYDLDVVMTSPSPYHYPIHTLQLKPWPSTRVDHQAIQAIGDLIEEHGIAPEDIDELNFKGPSLFLNFPWDNSEPKDYWEALYSVQWGLAMAALGHAPGREWLSEERLNDPASHALAKKVTITEDDQAIDETVEVEPTATKLVVGDSDNEIEIVANGSSYVMRKAMSETLGWPTRQMTWEQVASKFKAQAEPVLGDGQSREIVDRARSLEQEDDVGELIGLFKKA
jgi:2-methylcitrate dehydratase PrpD